MTFLLYYLFIDRNRKILKALRIKNKEIEFNEMIFINTLVPIWRSSNLSKLTPIIFDTELTHLGSEASI